ncbi:hypothetical protein [Paenibacillus sp. V4I7]|uniref:hypothetical protein n=1 Tax=Paenibacillus sp. V4I7 TaxID=3042307 RepID=UPI002780E495|nr:hypothetical protein [Paenibacillus sp. V4I7]MDQ0903526.1 high-affinity K+ transport system ATPase subunit B [Paenibacillus sp. V4I7]
MEGIVIRNNIALAVLIQFIAWVILVVSLTLEPFSWFLLPNVNNTPAFITVTIWFIQSLIVAHLIGYFVNKLLNRYKISDIDWKLSVHLTVSILHIVVISVLIIVFAGFEDL